MAANSSGNRDTPPVPAFTHPALNDWVVSRELDKLERSHERDQQHNPSARRLRQHAEAMEAVFDREIGRGRFADTPQLWAAVYSQILMSVCAKINSLLGNEHMRLWRTGGGRQATFEEAQRECSRVRASLEGKLNRVLEHCQKSGDQIGQVRGSLEFDEPDVGSGEDSSSDRKKRKPKRQLSSGSGVTPENAAPDKNLNKLPPKKCDLSNYLDSAGLTDKQHLCMSLRMEYGLTISEIARRLKISRKTVDEHIAAAGRRVDLAKMREGLARNKAKSSSFDR